VYIVKLAVGRMLVHKCSQVCLCCMESKVNTFSRNYYVYRNLTESESVLISRNSDELWRRKRPKTLDKFVTGLRH